MSQVHSKHKRRWLKRVLNLDVAKPVWLASAFLSPVFIGANLQESAYGQAPVMSQAVVNTEVNPGFVLNWLEYAEQRANGGDMGESARAFAAALRGRKMLGSQDPAVEQRLKAVEQVLLAKGLKQQMVIDAVQKLGELAPAPTSTPVQTAANAKVTPLDRRDQAAKVTHAALAALESGDRQKATELVIQAEQMGVPEEWFLPGQITVSQLKDKLRGATNVTTAAGVSSSPVVDSGVFKPGADSTSVTQASANVASPTASGDELYRQGIELLSQGNREGAYELFKQAWQFQGEMDPMLRNQLKDKLVLMQQAPATQSSSSGASPLQQLSEEQLVARQRMMSEVTGEIAAAEAHRESEPEVVAERLQTLRTRVSQANLDGDSRKRMLTIVDSAITSHELYMTQNRSTIEQNNKNRQVVEEIALGQEERQKLDEKIASLVETYNDLMDKTEYMQAEMVAKQVNALDPNSQIAKLLIANARNARRIHEYEDIRTMKEDRFVDAMLNVDEAAIPMDDRQPFQFGDTKRWEQLTKSRLDAQIKESERGMSTAEKAIWGKLKQPVLIDFKNRPLGEVAKTLSDMTGILIHVDQAGLALEGVTPELPVTLSLPSEITLRSALNLLLNSHNLDFQVRNEVLLITSARSTAQANVERTYSVKDLVVPIPDFVTDYNTGMAGALRQAYESVNQGLVARTAPAIGSGNVQLAGNTMDPNSGVLGQFNNMMPGNLPGGLPGQLPYMPGSPVSGSASPMMMGGPQPIAGGAAMADFGTLMTLIQETITPDDWINGDSSILPYASNLSLVVSAPQTTHEKIADLLESLRQLQDLQVTIEVKYVTLNDNFFERMGVDFDFKIDDNVTRLPGDDNGPSTVVGLSGASSAGTPFPVTADFDVTVRQESFTAAVPTIGGFDPSAGASLGFAILSDIEMFFFMNAAQGDSRTNVLQAPRVTMFDGQQASIADTVARPFVASVVPVVGDFAVAQQPVIVVLNEGTILNVQATVSPDKRFVRLTLNPTFSTIQDVETFTFEGTRTTRTGTNVLDPTGEVTGERDDEEQVVTGTTVQQPILASTQISTTVSVPDGGTILLGGIKRMSEARLERGVPILSKIPYVNRLFKNTSIARQTSTLMMTVTPRIIIQEEEEQALGINL